MAGYLFVYFTGEGAGGEQVYFSVSRDGLHWRDLNGNKPVLASRIGEGGVRDPFLVRHPQTGRFFLMGTDLCMRTRRDWDAAVKAGSRDIIIWSSDDLVRWTEAWSVTVAPEGAGCAWAPEAIWDEDAAAFLVFFASYTREAGEAQGKHRIYATHTDDFVHFTPPVLYMRREMSVIDTTIIRDEGECFRFSKDEETKRIVLDRGPGLFGAFAQVESPVLATLHALEGPECYRLPDGRWCLICDQFGAGKGYLPLVIDDLRQGAMHVLPEAAYDMGSSKKRHGGVLQITDIEYARLWEGYHAED